MNSAAPGRSRVAGQRTLLRITLHESIQHNAQWHQMKDTRACRRAYDRITAAADRRCLKSYRPICNGPHTHTRPVYLNRLDRHMQRSTIANRGNWCHFDTSGFHSRSRILRGVFSSSRIMPSQLPNMAAQRGKSVEIPACFKHVSHYSRPTSRMTLFDGGCRNCICIFTVVHIHQTTLAHQMAPPIESLESI